MRNWCCEDGRGHWHLEEAVCSVPRQVLGVTNELWGCSCRQLLAVHPFRPLNSRKDSQKADALILLTSGSQR